MHTGSNALLPSCVVCIRFINAGLYTPRVGLLEEIIHQSTAKGDIMEQYVDPAVQVRPYLGPYLRRYLSPYLAPT